MSDTDLVLETRGIGKQFGGVHALRNVDFRLRRNELRCLIGPNGAGKSTFFKLLSGQLRPSAGDILLEGQSIVGVQPHAIAQRGIGIKNQIPTVMDGLTVRENLWLAARAVAKGPGCTRIVEELATDLWLESILDRLVGELAHGQRQWVEIGMVIACKPKVVLLDEPAAGMSDEETERTAGLVRQINSFAAVVVVEHDMQFIKKIAGAVTVFHQGEILVEDSFDAVIGNATVRDVYLGRVAGSQHD
jgi:branched-chain amino acid transport system ATP-binding protein/urea transport system ATP-binding protein